MNARKQALKVHRNLVRFKMEVASHYGNKCACCGESKVEFLQLHHKRFDGWAHRQQIAKEEEYDAWAEMYRNEGRTEKEIEHMIEVHSYSRPVDLWGWVKRNGYPQNLGLELLCANCHTASRSKYIKCPHKQDPVERLMMLIEERGMDWLLSELKCTPSGLIYMHGFDIENPKKKGARKVLKQIKEI